MHQKLFTSQIFFFMSAAYTTIVSSNWKNNNTILMLSKIQTMRKLNNPTKASFAGHFLTAVGFNLLQWLYNRENKETF